LIWYGLIHKFIENLIINTPQSRRVVRTFNNHGFRTVYKARSHILQNYKCHMTCKTIFMCKKNMYLPQTPGSHNLPGKSHFCSCKHQFKILNTLIPDLVLFPIAMTHVNLCFTLSLHFKAERHLINKILCVQINKWNNVLTKFSLFITNLCSL